MSVEGVYQKPLLYNKFLPYEEKLNEEGRQLFEDIKKNLSIAVQKSELWPGALFWTNRLNRYARCICSHGIISYDPSSFQFSADLWVSVYERRSH